MNYETGQVERNNASVPIEFELNRNDKKLKLRAIIRHHPSRGKGLDSGHYWVFRRAYGMNDNIWYVVNNENETKMIDINGDPEIFDDLLLSEHSYVLVYEVDDKDSELTQHERAFLKFNFRNYFRL